MRTAYRQPPAPTVQPWLMTVHEHHPSGRIHWMDRWTPDVPSAATLVQHFKRNCSCSESAYCYTFLHMVCLSVICLSHSCPLFKLFDGFRCHLVGTLGGWMTHSVRWRPWAPEEEKVWGSNSQLKHAIVNSSQTEPPVLCCYMAITKDKLGGLPTAIPLLPKYFDLCCWTCIPAQVSQRISSPKVIGGKS